MSRTALTCIVCLAFYLAVQTDASSASPDQNIAGFDLSPTAVLITTSRPITLTVLLNNLFPADISKWALEANGIGRFDVLSAGLSGCTQFPATNITQCTLSFTTPVVDSARIAKIVYERHVTNYHPVFGVRTCNGTSNWEPVSWYESTVTLYEDVEGVTLLFLTSPAVTSASPNQISAVGGTTVTVFGGPFLAHDPSEVLCQFSVTGGAKPTTVATTVGKASVVCESPSGISPGNVIVSVSVTNGREFDLNNGFALIYAHSPPVITRVWPTHIATQSSNDGFRLEPRGHGLFVHLNGTGLNQGARTQSMTVRFGARNVVCDTLPEGTQRSADCTALRCLVPPADVASILVRNASVTIAISFNDIDYYEQSIPLIYEMAPVVYNVHPSQGFTGGVTSFDVVGSTLAPHSVPVSQVRCRYSSILGSASPLRDSWTSATSIQSLLGQSVVVACPSPTASSAPVGRYFVTISYNDGIQYSDANIAFPLTLFERPWAPVIVASPSAAPDAGGSIVTTVYPSSFYFPSLTAVVCRFGVSPMVPATIQQSGEVQCQVPALLPGSWPLDISFNGGVNYVPSQPFIVFNSTGTRIDDVRPSAGPNRGGTTVLLSGIGLSGFQGASVKCSFGGALTAATVLSSTQVLCLSPPVLTPNDPARLSAAAQCGNLPTGATSACASFTNNNEASVHCVGVTFNDGLNILIGGSPKPHFGNYPRAFFMYYAPPIEGSVAPSMGPIGLGGALVTVTGTRLRDDAALYGGRDPTCRFHIYGNGEGTGSSLVVDGQAHCDAASGRVSIVCPVPLLRDASWNIRAEPTALVTIALNGVDFEPDITGDPIRKSQPSYTYHRPLFAMESTPWGGPTSGGTVLTITGRDLHCPLANPALTPYPDGSWRKDATSCLPLVRFGPTTQFHVSLASFVLDGTGRSTMLVVVAPPLPPNHGLPLLPVAPGSSLLLSSVDLWISLDGNHTWYATPLRFGYYQQPAIHTITPFVGPMSGGTRITMRGASIAHHPSLPGLAVTIGGKPCAIQTDSTALSSDWAIVCIAPSAAAGSAPITVTLNGQAPVTMVATYRYHQPIPKMPPAPIGGPLSGGIEIVISTAIPAPEPALYAVFIDTATPSIVYPLTTWRDATTGVWKAWSPATMSTERYLSLSLSYNEQDFESQPGTFWSYIEPIVEHLTPTAGPSTGGGMITVLGHSFPTPTLASSGDSPASIVIKFTRPGTALPDIIETCRVIDCSGMYVVNASASATNCALCPVPVQYLGVSSLQVALDQQPWIPWVPSVATFTTLCPRGSYVATSQTASQTPLIRPDVLCHWCRPGYYSTELHSTVCTACPLNTELTWGGASSISNCTACPPGFTAPVVGSATCTACNAGQEVSGVLCVDCVPGTAAGQSRTESCEICQPGTFAANHGSFECSPCSPGTYSSTEKASSCEVCPAGSSTDGTHACITCPIGTFAAGSGSAACEPCPAGYTSHAGSSTCSLRPVSVTGIQPSAAAAGVGAVVTISGWNFGSSGVPIEITIGGQPCLSPVRLSPANGQGSSAERVVCKANITHGEHLPIKLMANTIDAGNISSTLSFWPASQPVAITLSFDAATFSDSDTVKLQSELAKVLGLNDPSQLFVSNIRAGSTVVDFYILSSPSQPDVHCIAMSVLAKSAESGELLSAVAGAQSVATAGVNGQSLALVAKQDRASDAADALANAELESGGSGGMEDWLVAVICISCVLFVSFIWLGLFYQKLMMIDEFIDDDQVSLCYSPLYACSGPVLAVVQCLERCTGIKRKSQVKQDAGPHLNKLGLPVSLPGMSSGIGASATPMPGIELASPLGKKGVLKRPGQVASLSGSSPNGDVVATADVGMLDLSPRDGFSLDDKARREQHHGSMDALAEFARKHGPSEEHGVNMSPGQAQYGRGSPSLMQTPETNRGAGNGGTVSMQASPSLNLTPDPRAVAAAFQALIAGKSESEAYDAAAQASDACGPNPEIARQEAILQQTKQLQLKQQQIMQQMQRPVVPIGSPVVKGLLSPRDMIMASPLVHQQQQALLRKQMDIITRQQQALAVAEQKIANGSPPRATSPEYRRHESNSAPGEIGSLFIPPLRQPVGPPELYGPSGETAQTSPGASKSKQAVDMVKGGAKSVGHALKGAARVIGNAMPSPSHGGGRACSENADDGDIPEMMSRPVNLPQGPGSAEVIRQQRLEALRASPNVTVDDIGDLMMPAIAGPQDWDNNTKHANITNVAAFAVSPRSGDYHAKHEDGDNIRHNPTDDLPASPRAAAHGTTTTRQRHGKSERGNRGRRGSIHVDIGTDDAGVDGHGDTARTKDDIKDDLAAALSLAPASPKFVLAQHWRGKPTIELTPRMETPRVVDLTSSNKKSNDRAHDRA